MTNIADLQNSLTALTSIVVRIPPVLQANADLGTRIISVLEDVLSQLRTATPAQADIDAMTASVTTTLSSLESDIAQVNATNVALQDEIAKATTSTQ